MDYENITQQLCGQVSFMLQQVRAIPEPHQSQILQRIVATLNKQLNQEYKQFPFAEVVE
jgi:hypothetical protein